MQSLTFILKLDETDLLCRPRFFPCLHFQIEWGISLIGKEGFTRCSGNSTRRKTPLGSTSPLGSAFMALTGPESLLLRLSGPLFTRTLPRIAFSFLIWPILVAAQDPPASGEPSPPSGEPSKPSQTPPGVQDPLPPPPGAQNLLPPSDPALAPSPRPLPIPAVVHAPGFLFLRPIAQPPVAAGYARILNISAGLSVVSLGLPSAGHAALSGMDTSISVDTSKHFGAKLDLGYVRAQNVFGSGHGMNMLSYVAGPVFLPSDGRVLSSFAHFLVGGARIAGPFPNINGGLNIGRAQYPAWAAGGGAEYHISPTFAFRVSIDYLHTHFFNPSGAIRGQNDLRIVNSIVYYGVPIRRQH